MGGGDHAPKAYQPANQPGADSAYMGTLGSLTNQDMATANLSSAGYNSAYQGVVNNPYDASMLAAINSAAGTAMGVGAQDISNAGAMTGAANATYGDANTAAGAAAPMFADANTLRAYAPMLAQLGFDPNMAQYNYGLGQTQDTQNVANAENGVAGSPFGAGLTGDAMATYNRNYQSNRAAAAYQALAALSSLYGSAGSLDTSGVGALTAAGGLRTTAGNLATGAGALAGAGVQTEATAATLPYATSNQIQSDRETALDEMVSGNAANSSALQGDVQGYGNYLQIGQGATALDQNAARINAQNSFMGQLGSLIGSLAGPALKLLPQGG